MLKQSRRLGDSTDLALTDEHSKTMSRHHVVQILQTLNKGV